MPTKKTGMGSVSRAGKQHGGDANPPAGVPFDRRLMERQLAAVERLLAEREFGSIEEANAFLQQALEGGGLPDVSPSTPLEQAQEIVYQALEATGRRRTTLARKALTISPDCADAYVLLAESTKDIDEARRLYEQGVQAGERALGEQVFQDLAGEFWGMMETRPYMRARLGLADVLWHLGEREVAITHANELLRLNPNDNQGVRYQLANWLLAQGDLEALGRLLAQYPDEVSAFWAYTRLLHALRTRGPGRSADTAFRRAMAANPFVPMYLLGLMTAPEKPPDYYGFGDPNEALVYLLESADVWQGADNEAAWIAEALARLMPARGRAGRRAKPKSKQKPSNSQPGSQKA